MTADKRFTSNFFCVCLYSSVALFLFSGCSQPNKANIDLRKQIDTLQSQVDQLKRQHDADVATIAGMKGATTVPSLPEDRLSQLYTVHGLKFGRLVGGWDADVNTPGDEGLKISVVPTDDDGQQLKAAGSFEVDAFDLAKAHDNRVGHWTFDVQQARDAWLGAAMMYSYVLKCPWQTVPEHDQLTIRVIFIDALTGRRFSAEREVHVNLPAASHS